MIRRRNSNLIDSTGERKGWKILRKREKYPYNDGRIELIPEIHKTIIDMENPYIIGIEGFFILETSIDSDPESIFIL
ncbi:MAG: hypothetical protein QXZ59_06360 [Nitrososphaeria archaeon]